MPTIASALAWARQHLDALEARLLLCHVCRCTLAHLAAWPEKSLEAAPRDAFRALVERRVAGEPVAYLLGEREFYGRRFTVTPATLIPRPETEMLVDLVLAHVAGETQTQHQAQPRSRPPRLLDLGTGSGVLAITLALENGHADVTAVDCSRAALAVAAQNAADLGANIHCVHSNWYEKLGDAKFSLIVANPPYIAATDPHLDSGDLRFEPRAALAAGASGLDDLATIVADAPLHLEAGGWLFMEHGFDQADSVRKLLADAGFNAIASWKDLAGIERVSGGRI
jgi:release factor glutamine methyltransferase